MRNTSLAYRIRLRFIRLHNLSSQSAEERNLAESFALWALRAAIRGAMSQANGQKYVIGTCTVRSNDQKLIESVVLLLSHVFPS